MVKKKRTGRKGGKTRLSVRGNHPVARAAILAGYGNPSHQRDGRENRKKKGGLKSVKKSSKRHGKSTSKTLGRNVLRKKRSLDGKVMATGGHNRSRKTPKEGGEKEGEYAVSQGGAGGLCP